MNSFIRDTLTPTGVPVAYMTYTGAKSEYIIFNYWSSPLVHADNVEVKEDVTVQIDIFSAGNFTVLAEDAKNRMIDAGFTRVLENSGYDNDMKMFRKTYRFNYIK